MVRLICFRFVFSVSGFAYDFVVDCSMLTTIRFSVFAFILLLDFLVAFCCCVFDVVVDSFWICFICC